MAPKAPYEQILTEARERFDAADDFTVSVEEEFAILDPETLELTNRFEDVQAAAKGTSLERNLVGEMREGLGSGWSVNGMTPTLRALSRGQVRALLVHADAGEPGFRCSGSGRLALTERDCRGEGDPIPVLDVVDDAIEEVLRQGVDVNVVFEPEARGAIEGLAGLLRFR